MFNAVRLCIQHAVMSALMMAGLFTASAQAAGFQFVLVADPDDKPVQAGVWYPSDTPAPDAPNTPFRQALALDGEPRGTGLPLIVISHGYGGWMGGHAATALALAEMGFVVIAPTHTGNNYEDESYPTSRWMRDRPRHIKRTIDHMLTLWQGGKKIDAARIGLFGFSAGGYTALVSTGGVLDVDLMLSHCERAPEEEACRLIDAAALKTSGLGQVGTQGGMRDERISAAVIAAPGYGFAFDRAALADVTVPIQLWAGAQDKRVPYDSNTSVIRTALPSPPEFERVEGAGHFAFIGPCNPRLQEINPKVWNMVCVDAPGFDRRAFLSRFNDKVGSFFKRHLKVQ